MGDRRGYDDDERLPWLEGAEEEDDRGPSPVKLILFVVLGLVAIGLIVGGLFWLANRNTGDGSEVALIRNEGDYKVRPTDPGGMSIDNQASAQVATSEGAEPQGQIDPSRQPEAPVAAPAAPATPAPAPAAEDQAPSGPTIQVGAYPSTAIAQREWASLSRRFPQLASLRHSIMQIERDGQTLFRLRASGTDAYAICARMNAAGAACMQVR